MVLNQCHGLWDTVQGSDLQRELRSRKSPYVFEKIDKSKQDSYESDGWEVAKVNKTSLKVRRSKAIGDALEDQILNSHGANGLRRNEPW